MIFIGSPVPLIIILIGLSDKFFPLSLPLIISKKGSRLRKPFFVLLSYVHRNRYILRPAEVFGYLERKGIGSLKALVRVIPEGSILVYGDSAVLRRQRNPRERCLVGVEQFAFVIGVRFRVDGNVVQLIRVQLEVLLDELIRVIINQPCLRRLGLACLVDVHHALVVHMDAVGHIAVDDAARQVIHVPLEVNAVAKRRRVYLDFDAHIVFLRDRGGFRNSIGRNVRIERIVRLQADRVKAVHRPLHITVRAEIRYPEQLVAEFMHDVACCADGFKIVLVSVDGLVEPVEAGQLQVLVVAVAEPFDKLVDIPLYRFRLIRRIRKVFGNAVAVHVAEIAYRRGGIQNGVIDHNLVIRQVQRRFDFADRLVEGVKVDVLCKDAVEQIVPVGFDGILIRFSARGKAAGGRKEQEAVEHGV